MRIFAVETKIFGGPGQHWGGGGGLGPSPNVEPPLSTLLEIMLRYFTVHTVVQHNAFYLLFRLFSALSFKVRL